MRAMAEVSPEAVDFAENDREPGSGQAARVAGGALPVPRFADPTPLGLIGLAIGCAALTPLAFGAKVGVPGLITAAVICVLFGGGCQLIAGLLNLANGNLLGGTLFAAFAFNWALNGWALWSLAHGVVPEHQILLATEAASLMLFVPLTYAFGHYSGLLFAFLLDIDVLYALQAARRLRPRRRHADPDRRVHRRAGRHRAVDRRRHARESRRRAPRAANAGTVVPRGERRDHLTPRVGRAAIAASVEHAQGPG